jgi:chemotaxis protein methyltransferase CheR
VHRQPGGHHILKPHTDTTIAMISINDQEFRSFQTFIYDSAGITLSAAKKQLVSGRLSKRVQARNLDSFDAYFSLLASGNDPGEVQTAVDLLTTNETYFFREPRHFEALRSILRKASGQQSFRVWSAACSTGEEVYSLAMMLDDERGAKPWELMGSDISTRVLSRARAGHYPLERTRHIPAEYLKRYCLKGVEDQEGTLLVQRALRQRAVFSQVNLNEALPNIGRFDVIFLRNVLIYFNQDTKARVVDRVLSALKPGGYFFIGHSESLHQVTNLVKQVAPSVYCKPQ